MKTDKFTGPNKVLLILGQRTCAHRDDCLELVSSKEITGKGAI